mmetsp:Transcript_7135/g.27321  ORF Transcript_7135/g.27321 Transcript_7135/m.27321 type:complete len:221 (-) Transcript_7135:873-1535(-)
MRPLFGELVILLRKHCGNGLLVLQRMLLLRQALLEGEDLGGRLLQLRLGLDQLCVLHLQFVRACLRTFVALFPQLMHLCLLGLERFLQSAYSLALLLEHRRHLLAGGAQVREERLVLGLLSREALHFPIFLCQGGSVCAFEVFEALRACIQLVLQLPAENVGLVETLLRGLHGLHGVVATVAKCLPITLQLLDTVALLRQLLFEAGLELRQKRKLAHSLA